MSGIDKSRVASIFTTFTETIAKRLDFQKGNLMKSVLEHVVNASRKG